MNEYVEVAQSLERCDLSAGVAKPVLSALLAAHRDLVDRLNAFEDNVGTPEPSADIGGRAASESVRVGRRKLILVPVSRGVQSQWAVRAAAGLAKDLGADVMIVHVVDDVVDGFALDLLYGHSELRAELRRRGQELLSAARRNFGAKLGVSELLREGNAGAEIAAAAGELGADLIVMGSRGRGRISGLLVGSTAQAVIKDAPCPVVVVTRDPDRIRAQPRETRDAAVASL